jgi:intracellular sulfur oxidation DsrE/DsrF family protein
MTMKKLLLSLLTLSVAVSAAEPGVIAIQVRENLRSVYPVTDAAQQNGVKRSELMPGVKLVAGAFPRLIDLQVQGFAYIKFE